MTLDSISPLNHPGRLKSIVEGQRLDGFFSEDCSLARWVGILRSKLVQRWVCLLVIKDLNQLTLELSIGNAYPDILECSPDDGTHHARSNADPFRSSRAFNRTGLIWFLFLYPMGVIGSTFYRPMHGDQRMKSFINEIEFDFDQRVSIGTDVKLSKEDVMQIVADAPEETPQEIVYQSLVTDERFLRARAQEISTKLKQGDTKVKTIEYWDELGNKGRGGALLLLP